MLLFVALFVSLVPLIRGASYPSNRLVELEERKLDPNCKCTAWEYVDQCDDECRQFRWRDCSPSGCGTEDESVPCFSVEWDDWSSCDLVSCTRTRTQACMCLMRRVSPEVCNVPLQTETESCPTEVAPEPWGQCDTSCQRYRDNNCHCKDPSSGSSFKIEDRFCDRFVSREQDACQHRTDYHPWKDCNADCIQERDVQCICEDSAGSPFSVSPSICGLSTIANLRIQKRNCDREWADWQYLQQCPDELPRGSCHVYAKRYRECKCINVDDQRQFTVGHDKCGEPFKESVPCNIEPGCGCTILPGTDPQCPTTCDASQAGRITGTDPTCSCYPWWYTGTCDPAQMRPITKYCAVQESNWNDWSAWSPSHCNSDCQQTRTRTCGCTDSNGRKLTPLSECPGEHQETRDCNTEWNDWVVKPCARQQRGQCEIKTTKYRQCKCAPNGIKMVSDQCEGPEFGIESCPVDEPCVCQWGTIGDHTCRPDRDRSCGGSWISLSNTCYCKPDWYRGDCTQPEPPLPDPSFCPPLLGYDWTEWSEWGACDLVHTCTKKRYRRCMCEDGSEEGTTCEGESEQEIVCETVWGPWQGGCSAEEPSCAATEAEKTRECCCKKNMNINFGGSPFNPTIAEQYCGNLESGKATEIEQCEVKPYTLTEWTQWSTCNMDCVRTKSRECYCEDASGRTPLDSCDSAPLIDEEDCEREWSDWSDPDCDEKSCIKKARPIFRKCMCKLPECELPRSECPGELFEMAKICPFFPADDPHCTGECECSPWVCDPNTCHHETRNCGPTASCDIEERAVKEGCCVAPAPEPECHCTEWGCKESCDATMIRTCHDACDIEEKAIAELCCEVDAPAPTPDSDGLFSDSEEQCTCGNWVTVACQSGGVICHEEQWRVCNPTDCEEESRTITDGDGTCCQLGGTLPGEECSDCGRWIDIGSCEDTVHEGGEDEEAVHGTRQWRSVRNCDESICEEFRCVPDGKHCEESLCGEWYDIGDCEDADGAAGVHQWRHVDNCYCEPYRCSVQEAPDNLRFNARQSDESMCTCTEWEEDQPCDERCVNSQKRTCTPEQCNEQFRIFSGYCCLEE